MMPTSRRVITVVGADAEGEIGDVLTGGVLPPPGATMMEKKLVFKFVQFDKASIPMRSISVFT